jgi:hypothetical protein
MAFVVLLSMVSVLESLLDKFDRLTWVWAELDHEKECCSVWSIQTVAYLLSKSSQ